MKSQKLCNISKGPIVRGINGPRILLLISETATTFNVSKQDLQQAKRNPEFPQPIKLSSGCTRFSKTDVEKFENDCASKRQLASRYGRLKTIA